MLAGPAAALRKAIELLGRIELISVRNRLLEAAGLLPPPETRSLDAIHVATALELGEDIGPLVTYDERMAAAARAAGLRVVSPT